MSQTFGNEPVLIVTAITALITVLASFIPSLSPERLAAINALVMAAAAAILRSRVTPA